MASKKGIYLAAFKSIHSGKVIRYPDMSNTDHQGGFNVHNVIEVFLSSIGA